MMKKMIMLDERWGGGGEAERAGGKDREAVTEGEEGEEGKGQKRGRGTAGMWCKR